MTDKNTASAPVVSHRFLDEAGDTTFFGKNRTIILGQEGVSHTFCLGMVKFKGDLNALRKQVLNAQAAIVADDYLKAIPSIVKKQQKGGFFFHATDDPPEVRQIFFRLIRDLDCTMEMVVGRKIPTLFARKHNHHESEFYADLLSHLIKTKLKSVDKLVLNIAERGPSTKNANLERALAKANERFAKKWDPSDAKCRVVFNVQNHRTEPLLNVADYFCWAGHRIFERGETRYYDYLRNQIRLVVDLYDAANYEGSRNYYTPARPLTAQNKLSPHSP